MTKVKTHKRKGKNKVSVVKHHGKQTPYLYDCAA